MLPPSRHDVVPLLGALLSSTQLAIASWRHDSTPGHNSPALSCQRTSQVHAQAIYQDVLTIPEAGAMPDDL